MIKKETARRIFNCYCEINACDALCREIAQVESALTEFQKDKNERIRADHKDVFGNMRTLELGVPNGESSRRLYKVRPGLGKAVIAAHRAEKVSELAELNERARIECDTPETHETPSPSAP